MKFLKVLLASLVSRKLIMTGIVCWVLYGAYWAEMQCIYTFTDAAQLQAFVNLSTQFNWALITALLAYLGINGITKWSQTTDSVLSSVVQNIAEKREEKIEQHIVSEQVIREYAERYRDDLSYRPLDTMKGVQP